jgi:hypothetical protein
MYRFGPAGLLGGYGTASKIKGLAEAISASQQRKAVFALIPILSKSDSLGIPKSAAK